MSNCKRLGILYSESTSTDLISLAQLILGRAPSVKDINHQIDVARQSLSSAGTDLFDLTQYHHTTGRNENIIVPYHDQPGVSGSAFTN